MSILDHRRGSTPVSTQNPSSHSVELRGLVKTYGDVRALDDVSIDIPRGTFAAILGPSGSGKTTLLNALGGFAGLDAGTVVVNGQDVTHVEANARGLGFVFQQYALFPHMTIAENIAFPLASRGIARHDVRQRVDDALALVELQAMGARRPSELSGGQQQRAALARALVYEPSVLLLDEPLAALDRRLRESLQRELRELHQRVGSTFLLVTHDQEEAMSMADLLIVMRDGQVEQAGTPAEVYDSPVNEFVAAFLGDCNLVRGTVSDGGRREVLDDSGLLLARAKDRTVGEAVTAVVRPEMLRLVNDDLIDGETVVEATVEAQQFMGREIVLRCSSDIGNLLARVQRSRSNAHADAVAAPGERVRLAWWPSNVHVTARSEGR